MTYALTWRLLGRSVMDEVSKISSRGDLVPKQYYKIEIKECTTRTNDKMAQSWLSYKKSNHLLDSSLVANDAYVALNFLNEKALSLDPKRRSMYVDSVRRGLGLLEKMQHHIIRSENEVEKEELYSMVKKISKDLYVQPKDLAGTFDSAIVEVNAILNNKQVHLEDSLKLLSSISKTASSELNAQYRYIR